jgi:flagellar biosynthesis GTPase FlhF
MALEAKMQRDTIFISYSRADSSGRDALVKHLEVVLGKPPRIRIFADTSIETGEEWRNRIRDEMDRALVVVLLVSADFLTSEFVQSVEIPRAALAARRGEAVIACLYVRHCAAEAFRIHVDDPNGKGFDIRVTDYQGLNDPNTPMARKGAKREQLLAQAAGKIVGLAETRLKAEEEKRQREAEAKAKEEAESRAKAEEARLKAEAEARAKAEAEAKAKEEAEARAKAEEEARAKAEAEAKAKEEAEARAKAEEEARAKAEAV